MSSSSSARRMRAIQSSGIEKGIRRVTMNEGEDICEQVAGRGAPFFEDRANASAEPRTVFGGGVLRSNHENWNALPLGMTAKLLNKFKAVHHWHHQIQQ